jgi:hypothetical protein
MLAYRDMIYILLIDRPVSLSQGRGILYTVICSFMKALGSNMYTVHLHTLGMIHNFQWIADIKSQLIKNTVCIVKFLEGVNI